MVEFLCVPNKNSVVFGEVSPVTLYIHKQGLS